MVFLAEKSEAIDDFESHLGEATEKFERNRGKFERVARPERDDGNGMAMGWQWCILWIEGFSDMNSHYSI